MPQHIRAVFLATILTVSLVGLGTAPAKASHDGDCSFPVTETDYTDTEVTVDEPPEEIVVLDAANSQTIWEIGAEDRVTGMPVRDYTAYLEGSGDRTDVLTDDGTGVDVETVIELDPDLVLAPNFTPEETIEQLRDAGLTVYQSPFEESFEDIYAKTELNGHFVGECEAAETTVDETREEVEEIREAVADRDRPRVLYYFFDFTAGDGTFISDLIETAGGENIAATAGIDGFQQISDETILEHDPEWIVTTDEPGSINTDQEPFPSTTAVQNDQVLSVNANLVSQAGPRVVEPLRTMAEAFHPTAFEATETPTETEPDTPTPTEESDDLTGFGAVIALIGLLGAALLAARRTRSGD